MAVHIKCEQENCVWRFSNGNCTRRNLRIDDIGTCQGQETVNRLMTQYPGAQAPAVRHNSHGYSQGHGRIVK